MTQYKLVSKDNISIARSSNKKYLISLKKTYPGSRIVTITTRLIRTQQAPFVRRLHLPRSLHMLSTKKIFSPPKIEGNIRIMPSSWIRGVDYDSTSNELNINMRGKWYGPWYIDPNTYTKFITGKAVPATTDKRRPPRWAEGIGPSLGAAYHKYIKIGGTVPLGLTLEQQVAQKYKLLGQIQ